MSFLLLTGELKGASEECTIILLKKNISVKFTLTHPLPPTLELKSQMLVLIGGRVLSRGGGWGLLAWILIFYFIYKLIIPKLRFGITVPFIRNTAPPPPPPRQFWVSQNRKGGGRGLTCGSYFPRIRNFWYNRQNFGPKTGEGVYHVVIEISDFGPKQGMFIRWGGWVVWKGRQFTVIFILYRAFYEVFWEIPDHLLIVSAVFFFFREKKYTCEKKKIKNVSMKIKDIPWKKKWTCKIILNCKLSMFFKGKTVKIEVHPMKQKVTYLWKSWWIFTREKL